MKNKKIISSLLIISMMVCLMPMKMFIANETQNQTVSLKIIPTIVDGTNVDLEQGLPVEVPIAHPGNIITYTVYMSPVQNLNCFQVKLAIPDGLIFNNFDGAGLAELSAMICANFNMEETIDTNAPGGNDENKIIKNVWFDNASKTLCVLNCGTGTGTGFNLENKYSSDANTVIMTFSCTVAQGATGEKAITFVEEEANDTGGNDKKTLLAHSSGPDDLIDIDISEPYSEVCIAAEPQYKIGDVNGDGKVNTTDAQLALNIYTGKLKYDPTLNPSDPNYISEDLFNEYKQRADVNKDNKVNTTDAQTILNIYSGRLIEVNGELVDPNS